MELIADELDHKEAKSVCLAAVALFSAAASDDTDLKLLPE
jgi:hypothetical protein